MKPTHGIILADMATDLGNRLVSLTLLDRLVFREEDPGWQMLGMMLAEQAPSILLGPVAGQVVDRMGAGPWLAIVLAMKIVLTGGLLLGLGTGGTLPLYLLFIVTSLFFQLGRLAIIPELVSPGRLIAFNALCERIGVIGGILACSGMGRIVDVAGVSGALFLSGLFFLVALTVVKNSIQTENPCRFATREHFTVEAAQPEPGVRRHWDKRGMQCFFWILGFVVFAGGTLNFGMPLLAKDRLGVSIAGWGIMMAVYQIGALAGTMALPCLALFPGQRITFAGTLLLLAGSMFAVGWVQTILGFGFLMGLWGGGFALVHVFLESRIQQLAIRGIRGKIAARMAMVRGVGYCFAGVTGIGLFRLASPLAVIWMGAVLSMMGGLIAFVLQWGHESR